MYKLFIYLLGNHLKMSEFIKTISLYPPDAWDHDIVIKCEINPYQFKTLRDISTFLSDKFCHDENLKKKLTNDIFKNKGQVLQKLNKPFFLPEILYTDCHVGFDMPIIYSDKYNFIWRYNCVNGVPVEPLDKWIIPSDLRFMVTYDYSYKMDLITEYPVSMEKLNIKTNNNVLIYSMDWTKGCNPLGKLDLTGFHIVLDRYCNYKKLANLNFLLSIFDFVDYDYKILEKTKYINSGSTL